MRHPYELGGNAFAIIMVWAQIIPFVALLIYAGTENDENERPKMEFLKFFLPLNFTLWLLLNITFFCTIDFSYLGTFFSNKTGSQYTCELFLKSEGDDQWFEAVFSNRIEYTSPIKAEVKLWVSENIELWLADNPDWFKIEMIPDEFLPAEVLEGNFRDFIRQTKRQKRKDSLTEVFSHRFGLHEDDEEGDIATMERNNSRIHPQT